MLPSNRQRLADLHRQDLLVAAARGRLGAGRLRTRSPGQSFALLLTVGLALATVLALLGVGLALAEPPPAPSTGEAAAVVARFYDAANAVLLTGDPTALDRVVDPGFVDRAPAAGVTPDRAGLARSLLALRAAHPGAQLDVADLVAAGDRAVAKVGVRDAAGWRGIGLPLCRAPSLWGPFEALRVAGGRVIERWGDGSGAALLEPIGSLSLAGMALAPRQSLELQRVTVAPGASQTEQIAI